MKLKNYPVVWVGKNGEEQDRREEGISPNPTPWLERSRVSPEGMGLVAKWVSGQ